MKKLLLLLSLSLGCFVLSSCSSEVKKYVIKGHVDKYESDLLMTMVNEFYKLKRINIAEFKTFLQLLNPFAPHITEELYERIGASITIAETEWPTYDEEKTILKEKTIAVQVNGKVRGEVTISISEDENSIKEKALSLDNVKRHIDGKEVVKVIVIKGKIVNVVVK